MSDTVNVRKDDLDMLVAACTTWMPADPLPALGEAFGRLLTAFDLAHADDDAPKAAKVIIVTAPANGSERRYDADGYTITDGTLFVNRYGITVACHPLGTWTSFRTGDAIADDTQRKAISIAKQAFRNINALGTAPGHGLDDAQAIATDALHDIWNETEA